MDMIFLDKIGEEQKPKNTKFSSSQLRPIRSIQGSHASWNSWNILDFNSTPGKSWNSP